MRDCKNSLAWLSIVTVSAALLSGSPAFAAPQKDSPCTATKIMEQSCANVIWVGVERDKPFIAERKTITVQQDEVQIHQEADLVARDAVGRIREELHGVYGKTVPFERIALGGVPSSYRDLNTNVDDTGQHIVTIVDCLGGKRIQLSPDTQYAIIQHPCVEPLTFRRNDGSYSDKVSQLIKANTPPHAIVENVGYKIIESLQARGVRITLPGSDKDGEWKGKPIKALEMWMSDDLGTILVWQYSDLIKGTTNFAFLKGIRREEPDASLFVVPCGYQIHH
jgi:hypothetical protein